LHEAEAGAAPVETDNQSEQSNHSHGGEERVELGAEEHRERIDSEEQEATIQRLRSFSRRNRLKGRQSTKDLAEGLMQQLQTASEALLDRLFHYLSTLPEDDDGRAHKSPIHGLTLPASAVGWISSQLFSTDSNKNMNESTDRSILSVSIRDRLSLLRFLLPRATHIRLTTDTWPPLQRKHGESQISAFDEDDEDAIHSFLEYYDRLVHRPTIDMRVFPNAKVVLLDQVPTCWIIHLDALRHSLQVLRVERSAIFDMPSLLFSEPVSETSLEESTDDPLLAPNRDDQTDMDFSQLTHVKLSQCSLNEESGLRGRLRNDGARDDPPLQRLTYLQSVSLAHNEISTEESALAGLSHMPFLAKLDLSYNRIVSLRTAHFRVGNLQTLILSHNQLRSVQGIDRLYALETLWLDHNKIADLANVSGLARLPELKSLKLKGNPFQQNRLKAYRVSVLDLFRECRLASLPPGATFRQLQQVLPVLDDKPASLKELKALRGRTFRGIATAATTAQSDTDVDVEGEVREESESNDIRDVNAAPDNPTPIQRWSKRRIARIELEYSAAGVPAAAAQVPDSYGSPPTIFTVLDVLKSIAEPESTNAGEEAGLPIEKADEQIQEEGAIETAGDESFEKAGEVLKETEQIYEVNASPFDEATKPKVDVVEFAKNGSPDGSISHVDEKLSEEGANSADTKQDGKVLAVDEHSDALRPVTESFHDETKGEQAAVEDSKAEACDHPMDMDMDLEDSQKADDTADLHHLSISPIKLNGSIHDAHELKASAATTATTADTNLESNDYLFTPAKTETVGKEAVVEAVKESEFPDHSETPSTPGTPSPAKLALRVVSFPENVWQDDNISVPSSIATPHRDEVSGPNKYQLAEANSKYAGPDIYRKLLIRENLEIYFRLFVFAGRPAEDVLPSFTLAVEVAEEEWQTVLEKYPKIQLWPIDRRIRDAADSEKAQLAGKPDSREEFGRVWRENVVACGKPALWRLTPNRAARYGFHGELLWSAAHTSHLKPETVAVARAVIICFSDTAMYIILDHDAVTARAKDLKRRFPLPIPHDASFEDAKWPHALARHPFHTLRAITIGFGFQRLTLRFSNSTYPCPDDFSYTLLISNKLEAVSLLRELQQLANEAREKAGMAGSSEEAITIENDDRHVLDALGVAVAPDVIGMVLQYQILQQRWKNGDRGTVRRVCVVTDTKLFLLDEDYVGDGSESIEAGTRSLGETVYRLVDSADLQQIDKVHAADADPRAITIVIRPLSRLQRSHNWRLLCRDRTGAERLVEDVRKAMSLAK